MSCQTEMTKCARGNSVFLTQNGNSWSVSSEKQIFKDGCFQATAGELNFDRKREREKKNLLKMSED